MTGKYYDELAVGAKYSNGQGRTITETDNVLFCAMTMNGQPLHLNEDFSSHTEFGHRLVNGVFTLGLAVGLSVSGLTEGTIVANLGYDRVVHPNPVFHGDTLYVESEVLEMRPSKSRPKNGVVRLKHTGRNQHGEIVVEFERTVLFLRKPGPAGEKA
ncbi:MAG TPA: MaoC family dehydratase [Rectinemataceae bacterium]|nr:MaoC family dehydratase [Rectinemataceae bacterium]